MTGRGTGPHGSVRDCYGQERWIPPTGTARTFETGATRDTDEGKLDYEAFFSPLVMEAYASHMDKHRVQSDGVKRAPDNWQKGIPQAAYMKSMWRHFMDVWRLHRGWSARDTMTGALCALMFNVMGMLHEHLKKVHDGQRS